MIMKTIYPYFSQNPLNRLDEIRRNSKEVNFLKNLESSLFLLFSNEEIIFDKINKKYFFKKGDFDTSKAILLGRKNNINYFTLNIEQNIPKYLSKSSIKDFINTDILEENQSGIIAQAAAILNWHKSHQFCSSCGEKTCMSNSGWKRDCPSCKKEHFPRTDPVVMMLVTYDDYCLLGRGVNFEKNRYSCLAGFMESGESIENAAKRELYEEVGLVGEEVEYIMSQPWPFPYSLMIGVHVEVKSKKLKLDPNEIADAKWIHKEDIKQILNGNENHGVLLPRKMAISRNLLEFWV